MDMSLIGQPPYVGAYYDADADIAWFPQSSSTTAVSEEHPWGLIDHDERSGAIVGVEVWNARTTLGDTLVDSLDALPSAS